MDEAIVGANPDDACFEGRFIDREDGVVVFDGGVVFGDGAAGGTLFGFVVAGEVGTHDGPVLALVGGGEQDVGAGVEAVRIVGREEEGEAPLEAILHGFNAGAHGVIRPGIDVALGGGDGVVTSEKAIVGAGVDVA